jgi:hypothetical protein
MSSVRGFISYDTPDGLGIRSQVKVTKGSLPIKGIRKNDAGTMAQISFDHEAGGMNFPISGHIPVDSLAYAEAEKAKADGTEIAFRIETQRKTKVDRKAAFPTGDKVDGVDYLDIQGGKDVVKKLVQIGSETTHEIRTDVNEDDRWMNISAVNAPAFIDDNGSAATTVVAGGGIDPQEALAQFVECVKSPAISDEMARMVGAIAIAAGASIDEFTAAATLAKKAAA